MQISLNGKWKVRTDAEENGLAQNWAALPIESEMEVMVPGCIQQLDCLAEGYPPHNDMRNGYKNTFFMEKSVILPKLKKGEHCRLNIGGVIPSCHIWINGKYVSKNILGLNRVCLDITDYIFAGDNRVTLAITEQYESLVTGMRFAGMDWSGIYSGTYIEISGGLQFHNAYISVKNGNAKLCALLENSGDTDFCGNIDVFLKEKCTGTEASVKAKSVEKIEIDVDVEGLPRWSYRSPKLIEVKVTCVDNDGNACETGFKTGLREITVEGDRILVDGIPTFFAGTGSEYYSPTIAPLTDRNILEERYKALKAYGFNFYRCHTHVPTEEEMCIADEMGIMLEVEFGLVSNFNKTTPVEEGFEMLEKFIQQTRKHPSVFVYCLGNEGSQLMVDSYIERNKAKLGYQIIKENTDNQLGIIAFGMQGELPELANDFESPHLWSDNFLWAYDGLTDIPWEDLKRITGGKPCVIHEYGKFGVWPSRKEEKDCTVENGIKPDYGTQSYQWLKKNGMQELEERLVSNSRRAANSFNRIILEDARRQPFCSGYALWTFFRRSRANAGLSDDLGKNLNGDSEWFQTGVNADVAILMDRGFLNRAFPCEIRQNIEISVSNFGIIDLNGKLKITLRYREEELSGLQSEVTVEKGETKSAVDFEFSVPIKYAGKKLRLTAELIVDNSPIAKNEWELWAFDTSADKGVRAYLHVDNLTMFRALKKAFPNAQRLSSVNSIVIGCRSWKHSKEDQIAGLEKDILVISDVYDDVVKDCIQKGYKVLLLDSGKLPEEWMLPPICEDLGERDTGRFFTSFRAGWDKGNLVTIVNEDCLLGNFPQEGFCDLHFYDMVQSARIMKPEVIDTIFCSKTKRLIASISKMPRVVEMENVVQDPNAIKEQTASLKSTFQAREQGYYLKINERLAVCTLKLTDNPSGLALLKESIKGF